MSLFLSYGSIPLLLLTSAGGEGAEVIYALRNNDTLSKEILNEFMNNGIPVRKAYQRRLPSDNNKDYYFIHRETGLIEPIIIEYGFIDNNKDAYRVRSNYKNYVEAVLKAISKVKGFEYKEPTILDRYIVKKGDSLWSIAKKLDTNVDDLKRLNNLKSNMIYINQELKVPNYMVTSDSNISYVVKKGDTLWSISREYGISVSDLKSFNNLSNDFITPGSLLKIPSSNQIVTEEENVINEGNIVDVKKGDTLYSISKKYGVSVNDLKTLNNLDSDVLKIGTKLLIPSNINETQIRVVKKGDSLWAIAREYNTTIDDIKRLNNLTSDVLIEGMSLKIKRNTK